jgi:hypothetical protein
MRNISEKLQKNQNKFFVQLHISESRAFFWDNVEKYDRATPASDDNMACAHCMLDK